MEWNIPKEASHPSGGVMFNQAGKGVDREKPQVGTILTHCLYISLNPTPQGLFQNVSGS